MQVTTMVTFFTIGLYPTRLKGNQMDTNATLIRTTAVSKKTTLAKSTIWLKVSQGLFPKPIKLSPSIYVWKESDIDAWIDALVSKDLEVSNEVIK